MLSSEQFKLNLARGSTIGERLDNESRRVISKNRHYVRSLAEIILVCAQQGLALRGHGDNMDGMIQTKTLEILVFWLTLCLNMMML